MFSSYNENLHEIANNTNKIKTLNSYIKPSKIRNNDMIYVMQIYGRVF